MSIDIKVSLHDYEKKLLRDVFESFLSQDFINGLPDLSPESQVMLLHSWSWTRKLAEDACTVCFSEDWIANHGKSAAIAWPVIQRFWERDVRCFYSNHSRLALLLRDNPELESRFKDTEDDQLPTLRLYLSSDDRWYWNIVAILRLIVDGDDKESRKILTQLCQSGALREDTHERAKQEMDDASLRWPNDTIIIGESSQFEQPLAVEITSILQSWESATTFEIWSLVQMCCTILRSSEDTSRKLHAAMTDCKFLESHANSGSGFINKKWKNHSKGFTFRHPSRFLEYIPWTSLSLDTRDSGSQMLVWCPERRVKFDHHLHSEEEVYRFCVNNELFFQDSLREDGIIFQQTPLKTSAIWGELHNYWMKWNDCAITKHAESEQWILLETISGIQFRKLYEERDHIAAQRYFQRFVDDGRFGRVSEVAEVLGLTGESPQYDGFLEIIPFSEIHSINFAPLAGTNGLVYRAKWTCPQKIDIPASEIREVALKTTRLTDAVDERKFLTELDASLRALAARSVRCIRFYGITKVPSNCEPFPPDTLFMVFEWAELGSVLQYLESRLTGSRKDWEIVFDCIEDIAVGLDELHRNNIIHRDIHPNNVLVTTRPTPRDASTSISTEILLVDLGEGLEADKEQSLGRKYYGNVEYWAPEVRKHHQYSFASDIYSAGRLMAEMVQVRWRIVLQRTGEMDQSVPRDIAQIIRMCMAEAPEARPNAEDLVYHIQDVHMELMRETSDGDHDIVFDNMVDGSQELNTAVESESGEFSDLDEDGIPF